MDDTKYLWGCRLTRSLTYRLNIQLTYVPAFLHLGIYPREIPKVVLKKACKWMLLEI